MRRFGGALFAVALLGFCSTASAGTIAVGAQNAGGGDCVPFGCGYHAQFVYDASYFSSPVTITDLTFFNRFGSGNFNPSSMTFTLSTTSSSVASPSATFASNTGADAQLFGTYVLAGSMPSTFTFSGAPFAYNPANGNLLLDVVSTQYSTITGYANHNDDGTVPPFLVSRVVSFTQGSATGFVEKNYGPVTEFTVTGASAVPEPGTLGLIALGMASLLGGRRGARRPQVPTRR